MKTIKKPLYLCAFIAILIGCSISNVASALTFSLPSPGNSVVGHMQWARALPGDTFSSLGRRYDLGYFELVEANPGIDPDNIPAGTVIVIPTRFILPPVSRQGIVINLAELRVYYYPPGRGVVVTYPVGIGRQGWMTPLGMNHIIQKTVNPTWNVPQSIRDDRAKDGVDLPKSVPPGPDNPLGGYAMRLSQPTYLMHGTNDYTGVGRRSSSGCIRMYPEDIETLFHAVNVGTRVNIVNSAYKAGWSNGKLYLEVHVPLQEDQKENPLSKESMRQVVASATASRSGQLNWGAANQVVQEQNGVPQVIGSQS